MEIWNALISAAGAVAAALIAAFAGRRSTQTTDRRGGLLTVMWASITVALASTAALFWVLFAPSGGQPGVEISHPQDGSSVQQVLTVRGSSVNIPSESSIWVVLYSADVDRYYPQNEPATPEAEGAWSSTAHIGGDTDAGLDFDLLAVVADPDAETSINAYLTHAASTGSWDGLSELPTGAETHDRITVTRR